MLIESLVKYLSKETGLAILRVTRDYYKELATCLTLINQLDGQPAVITILHCSGNLYEI
jgi:RNase P/RNase MRP subunit POP5